MEETKNHKDTTLSRLPVVICLAVVCTFLWGSATPAIKIGYEQFHIEGTDSWSIIVFAGLRFLLAWIDGDRLLLYTKKEADPASGGSRKLHFKALPMSDGAPVLLLLYGAGLCNRGSWGDHNRYQCISFNPDRLPSVWI